MKIPFTFTSIGTCGGSLREWVQAHLEEKLTPFTISYNGAKRLLEPFKIKNKIIHFKIFRNKKLGVSVCIPDENIKQSFVEKVDDANWEREPYPSK